MDRSERIAAAARGKLSGLAREASIESSLRQRKSCPIWECAKLGGGPFGEFAVIDPSSNPVHVRSRQAILDRLDSRIVPSDPLPDWNDEEFVRFDDPVAQFVDLLKFVGGEAHFVERADQIEAILLQIPVYREAKRIASVVPEAVDGNVDVHAIDDPHLLASLDWMIAKGEFLVAENGAIWIEGETLPHRVMLFIAQYLAIVVSRTEIVQHLHQAYRRIGQPKSPFGVFVSGPSKTADIEQSLVLGAHGCRSLQVFLLP